MTTEQIPVFHFAPATTSNYSIDPVFFQVKMNPLLVQHVITGFHQHQRQWSRTVKNRSAVRGGGRKPWKQKGTGRARQGSIRAPQWRGGGVVFGPRNKSYHVYKINRRTKNQVLHMVLVDKYHAGRLHFFADLTLEQSKTKTLITLLKRHPDWVATNTLLVVTPEQLTTNLLRATHNLQWLSVVTPQQLHCRALLAAGWILTTVASWKVLVQRCLQR